MLAKLVLQFSALHFYFSKKGEKSQTGKMAFQPAAAASPRTGFSQLLCTIKS
jgi:hypothetical protein